MTRHKTVRRVVPAAVVAVALVGAACVGPAMAGERDGAPVHAIERSARPLDRVEPGGGNGDLRPFGRMVGDAKIVGVGEATHSSREFVTVKQHLMKYLAEEKGFTTFSMEISWSTGLRLDDYVVHGRGDPRRIMHREMQGMYRYFNNEEFLDLVRWMRAYNVQHETTIRFMGNDLTYAGSNVFDEVTGYMARHRPAMLPEVAALYRDMRPAPDTGLANYLADYQKKPPAERKRLAANAERALQIVRETGDSGDADEHAWAVQHASTITQTAHVYTLEEQEQLYRFRDEKMADNAVWWQRHTADRMLLSAQNGHVGYRSNDPEYIPKPQGAYLRELIGDDYVNAGFTFHHGSFNAGNADGQPEKFTVGPPKPSSNEHALDQVRYEDYMLDMRTAPEAAERWLAEPRATRNIGLTYPVPYEKAALGRSYDLLIHLDEIEATTLLP